MRLANKVALITGGAAGIGLATAQLCLAEGARVMLVDTQAAALAAAVAALDTAQVAGVRADVSAAADTVRDVEATLARFGRSDIFSPTPAARARCRVFPSIGSKCSSASWRSTCGACAWAGDRSSRRWRTVVGAALC